MAATSPGDPRSERITLKGGLRSLLKGDDAQRDRIVELLTDAASNMSAIATRGLLLVKLFVLHKFEGGELPRIDMALMLDAMKIMSKWPANAGKRGGEPSEVMYFYAKHVAEAQLLPADDVRPSYALLGSALGYMAKGLVASVETNIEQHYVEYVEAYVNALWDKRSEVESIKASYSDNKQARNAALSALTTRLRAIKTDLMAPTGSALKSPPDVHAWVREHRGVVLPAKAMDRAVEVWSDVRDNAQDYLAPMLRITKTLEAKGARLRHVLPLRTSVVPMHVTLDTATLAGLLFKSGAFDHLGMNVSTLVNKATACKKEIWAAIFRMNERIFHSSRTSSYVFDHMIRTDGVSCCVVHRRRDVAPGYRVGRHRRRRARETYVDELSADERCALQGKVIVGVDPGMDNLLYFSTEGGERHCRYTQAQRLRETDARKYERKELEMRKTATVEGRTVVEWEADLSRHSFKTVSFEEFGECIRAKLLVNSKLMAFYRERTWRKLRLYGYLNRRRSETRMLQRLRETFGPPEDVVIGIGDWAQREHMPFKEPTKGKGFRTTLRRGGYRPLLVDEFRTSVQCSHCRAEAARCDDFVPSNARPSRDYRLLLCPQCGRRWKRDANGANNIALLTRTALEGLPRPAHLRRQQGTRRAAEPDDAAERAAKRRRQDPVATPHTVDHPCAPPSGGARHRVER
jgi:hypothetical protein